MHRMVQLVGLAGSKRDVPIVPAFSGNELYIVGWCSRFGRYEASNSFGFCESRRHVRRAAITNGCLLGSQLSITWHSHGNHAIELQRGGASSPDKKCCKRIMLAEVCWPSM